jgi:alkanesulfonate monooxygenase SsuD/methylene tetrahydromethanopterin reductase-like flavin-dependent oxidoreductase (luciferase family)
MEVGVGLPNAVTGTTGDQLVEFAREGELQGFSSLGTVDRLVARVADGWIMGAGPPDTFVEMSAKVKQAWADAGREGEPRLMALSYFSLGPDAEENAKKGIGSYYEWLGEIRDMIVASVATDPETVRQYATAFEQAGCDELIFFPASGDPQQASLLREALEG